jgi:hypothetical protein
MRIPAGKLDQTDRMVLVGDVALTGAALAQGSAQPQREPQTPSDD